MNLMTRLTVAIPSHSYDVWIENGLLNRAGELVREVIGPRQKLFVVTVAPVRKKWGKKLAASLARADYKPQFLEMPDGERYKALATVETLAEQLVKLGADRRSAILAFGGGVIGDVAGFLASLYMRGVDFIQIPTTVLAQVDASIGGKTGVNLRAGKNLVGTFHQPKAVLIDPGVLVTLPEREYHAGLYEALKSGIIGDPNLFRLFENSRREILSRETQVLERVIADSVRLKANVVSSDERENGLRQVLNLGHTIGHALEAETAYRRFLHGEAIAWGMVAAANLALTTSRLDSVTAGRMTDAVLALGPLPKVAVRTRNIVKRLQSDKKTKNGVIHFILPREIGKVEIVDDVPERAVISAVDELRRVSGGR
jgi:3-dehydroquinate synthase